MGRLHRQRLLRLLHYAHHRHVDTAAATDDDRHHRGLASGEGDDDGNDRGAPLEA